MAPAHGHDSSQFANRVKTVPGLHDAVFKFLVKWPHAGKHVCGALKTVDIPFGSDLYTVFVSQGNQEFTVLGIYLPSAEQKLLDLRLEQLRSIFCRGQR